MSLRILSSSFQTKIIRRMAGVPVRDFSIKIGDNLPDKELTEGTPGNKVSIKSLFTGRKGIVFGVPGAFTPTCSNVHLHGFIQDAEKWKEQGFDPLICVSVNDVFVMAAWGEEKGASGKVRMLSDTDANFTKAIGMDFDATGILGGTRSKRYSLVVEDGVVTGLSVEEDPGKATCTSSKEMLDSTK